MHLSRRHFMGQVRAACRRGAFRRSSQRCHARVASAHGGTVGTKPCQECLDMTARTAWFVKCRRAIPLALAHGRRSGAASVPAVDSRLRGKVDAPVTMIEYSDFTCGYCLKFFKETWPKIQASYVDTGKVRFLYKDYPRADQGPGLTAALAARCAGDQGTYWPMHDRLFSADGRLDADSYTQHAKAIGLNQAKFRQCLRDAPHVQSIFQDREEANSWGFRRDARVRPDAHHAAADHQRSGHCDSRRISVRGLCGGNREAALGAGVESQNKRVSRVTSSACQQRDSDHRLPVKEETALWG